ncbi:MAG: sigma-70 family RNA polymerase sigma factor [Verrucomicrobiota bacterium]
MPDHPLERLYDDHASALFAFAVNLTRSEADARDALQEVFLKLARRGALPSGLREERGYLLRMVHHAVVDTLRRREVRSRAEDEVRADLPVFAASSNPDDQAFRTQLSAALGELPPDQRAVVHLKLWEGLTFERIAMTLEISPNTAASRYRYGLDKLRYRLRPLYDEIQ